MLHPLLHLGISSLVAGPWAFRSCSDNVGTGLQGQQVGPGPQKEWNQLCLWLKLKLPCSLHICSRHCSLLPAAIGPWHIINEHGFSTPALSYLYGGHWDYADHICLAPGSFGARVEQTPSCLCLSSNSTSVIYSIYTIMLKLISSEKNRI